MINEKNLTGLSVIKGPDHIDGLNKPTYFKLNAFTFAYQQIVDTYGIPSYKEVNPAVFTCISFPFFFGVMFGDLMHGSILFCFGTYLCFSKREPGTIGATFADVRYLLLLMGFFATYCGAIYNDYTSMATMMFGEGCYTTDSSKLPEGKEIVPVKGMNNSYWAEPINDECVYKFGVDPIWFRSA